MKFKVLASLALIAIFLAVVFNSILLIIIYQLLTKQALLKSNTPASVVKPFDEQVVTDENAPLLPRGLGINEATGSGAPSHNAVKTSTPEAGKESSSTNPQDAAPSAPLRDIEQDGTGIQAEPN